MNSAFYKRFQEIGGEPLLRLTSCPRRRRQAVGLWALPHLPLDTDIDPGREGGEDVNRVEEGKRDEETAHGEPRHGDWQIGRRRIEEPLLWVAPSPRCRQAGTQPR